MPVICKPFCYINMANKKIQMNMEEVSDFFHNLFVKNFQVKLIVLLITIIIWSYTMLRNEYTTKLNIPFEVVNIQEGKVLKQNIPENVKARFQGDGLDFFFLLFQSRNSFRLVLDLSTIKWFYDFDLNNYYSRHPENVILPRNSNVQLINIVRPESLSVELDDLGKKKIPVRSRIITSLEHGYTKYELNIDPDSVLIKGPKSFLDEIRYINTKKIVKKDVSSPININIELQDFGDKNISVEPEKVQVTQMVDQIVEKVISGIPIEIIDPPPEGKIETQPAKITLYISGGFSKIKNIDSDDISATINLEGQIKTEQKFYKPEINGLGNNIEINRIEPAEIRIRYIEQGEG